MSRFFLLLMCLGLLNNSRVLAQGARRPGQTPAAPNSAQLANQAIKDAQSRLSSQNNLKNTKAQGSDRILQKATQDAAGSATDFNYLSMKPDELRKRLSMRGPTLTAREAALLKALDSVVDFDKVPLTTILEYLRAKTKQNFYMDTAGLEEAKLDYETPVTLKLKKATARELLKKALDNRGMDYVLASDGIMVVTREQAVLRMTVRQYQVGDMLGCRTRPRAAVLRTAEVLIQAIQNTIKPGQWGNGASITYHETTEALVVRASAEVHLRMHFGTGK
jgi:hypothetical protein